MNAQVKPAEQAAIDIKLINRQGDVWEIDHDPKEKRDRREAVMDEIQGALFRDLDKILENHANGDDADTGRIISEVIGGYGIRLHNARRQKELEDAFLPSWRDA